MKLAKTDVWTTRDGPHLKNALRSSTIIVSLGVSGEESSVHQSQDVALWEEGASRGHDPPTGHQRSQKCAGRILQFLAPIQRGRQPQGSGPTLAKILLS